MYKLLICFFITLSGFTNPVNIDLVKDIRHPFYVSVIDMNANATAKTLEISCKFFSDDLEQIIEKNNKTQLDITLEKYKTDFDKYIPGYILKHFQLIINGKTVSANYTGFEKEKESAYAYFEVTNITSIKTVSITNSLLYDFVDQETNIMHITVLGKRQSTKLDYPDSQVEFNF